MFRDGTNPIVSKINCTTDGVDGGVIELFTKENGGNNLIKKVSINSTGSLGFGTNPSYGNLGEVLTSQGGSSPPIWAPASGGGGGGGGTFPEPYFSGYQNVDMPNSAPLKLPNQLNTAYGGASIDLIFYYFPAKLNNNYVFTPTSSGTSSGSQANYFNVSDPQAFMKFPDVGVYRVHIQLWTGGGPTWCSASLAEMTPSPAAGGSGQITDILYTSTKYPHPGFSHHMDLDMDIVYETTEADQQIYLISQIQGGGSIWTAAPAANVLDPRNSSKGRVHVYKMK